MNYLALLALLFTVQIKDTLLHGTKTNLKQNNSLLITEQPVFLV